MNRSKDKEVDSKYNICSFFFFFYLFFFFFKQKPAYEIVDCDWSSDVCSSDLLLRTQPARVPKQPVILDKISPIDRSLIAGPKPPDRKSVV